MKISIHSMIGLLFLLGICCSCNRSPQVNIPKFTRKVVSPEALQAHSQEFNKQVIEIVDGVHVAIGYGLANSILIEGDDGVIIVDCMESNASARLVKDAFNEITDKPVKAIIYTHNHADHIFGAGVMAGDDQPEVYSHVLTNTFIDRLLNVVRPIMTTRSFRMFGNFLDSGHENCGIGSHLNISVASENSILRPTVMFEDTLTVKISGVELRMVHAPGETQDQLFIHLPDHNMILCGDNFYKAFPNLYTIRGTSYRDVNDWVNSLDKIRYMRPDYLIPSHTLPLVGADTIFSVLTDYRDAIQFVHDQTIRHINLGKTPNELAEQIVLPPHLSASPYLQEFYGRADWSAKSVFSGYLGFFDGNPSTLLPLPELEKAEKMAALAGGESSLQQKAQKALDEEAYQWALELTDYLLRLNSESDTAKEIRYQALLNLGEQQTNPNARYYYLTSAKETKGFIVPQKQFTKEMTKPVKVEAIFKAMATRLNPEKTAYVNKIAIFHFPDVKRTFSLTIRKGIVEVQEKEVPDSDLQIQMDATTFKELAAKVKDRKMAFLKGEIKVEPGIGAMTEFMDYFK